MNPEYKLTELNKAEVLPEDCNDKAEKYARTFMKPMLLAAMRKAREAKLHGRVVYHPKGKRDMVVFAFTRGVCKHYNEYTWLDDEVMIDKSTLAYSDKG